MFRKKCISGIEANREQCGKLLEESMSLLTALNPHIGYELTTEIAREVKLTDKTVRDVVLEKNIFTEEKLNEILSPENMTRPGISGTVDSR